MPNYGLILTLGGAPLTGLTVKGIGIFNPVTPTPLEDCHVSLEDAQAYDADPGCPLSLVEIDGEPVTDTADTEVDATNDDTENTNPAETAKEND